MQAQLEFAGENGYTDVAGYVALYEKQMPQLKSWKVRRMNCNRPDRPVGGPEPRKNSPNLPDLLANPSFDAGNGGWIEDGGSPALGHQKNDKYQDPDDESVVMDQFCEKWTKTGRNQCHTSLSEVWEHAFRPLPFVGRDFGLQSK